MDPFVLKVFVSLLTGIIWVIASTHIAERVSGKLGGLIVGFPSTAVISLLFIGLTQGMDAARVASVVMPFSSGLYCFYFIAFLLLTKRGFITGFVGSLIVWLFFAFSAARIAPTSLLSSVAVWFVLCTICIWWVVAHIHIDHRQIPKKIISSPTWVKAVITGMVIGAIVIVSKLAGPVWGGILGTFPALTTATYFITIRSGGVEFTRLIAKNVLISTTTTIGIFATLSYFLFPVTGLFLGTVLSYIGLLVISVPLYFFVFEKLRD